MNIAVLSRNATLYSTQSIVEAAKKRGHNVRVLDHMLCDLVIDTHDPAIFYNFQKLDSVHAVIPRIGTAATSYGSSVIRQFEKMGVFSTLSPEPLLKTRNKLSCLQHLAAEGILVPRTAISNNLYTLSFTIDQIGPSPHIVKLASGTQGLGVILSETKSNAESIIEAFQKSEEKILIQKYIAESRGTDIRVFVIDGEIVASMKRIAKPGEFRSNIHRGAQSQKIELTEEEKKTALLATEIMGLKIAGVDMLQSKDGPMVLEVNASPGLEGIESTSGVDVAKSIIEFVERNVLKND